MLQLRQGLGTSGQMRQDVTSAQPADGNRADPYVPMAGFIFDFNVRECVADTEDPNNKEDMSAYIGMYGPLHTCGQPCKSVALANSQLFDVLVAEVIGVPSEFLEKHSCYSYIGIIISHISHYKDLYSPRRVQIFVAHMGSMACFADSLILPIYPTQSVDERIRDILIGS